MDYQTILFVFYVCQQFTIYVGFFFLITGLFGNAMNIIIFSSLRIYRTTPCTFYFLVGSIFNGLYIIINLTSRITEGGYNIYLTNTSESWCKARQFFIATLGLIAFNCSCLATIDQFFATSRNAHLRQYSNIKSAHRIMLVVIIVWCLHGIPCLLYFGFTPTSNGCSVTNDIFAAYIPIFVCVLLCAVPVFVMIVFGFLTYLNIRQTTALVEQHADRQLTRMIFIQVVLLLISNIPFGAFTAYGLITKNINKSQDWQVKEYIAIVVLSLFNYVYYVGNFYMFLISSSRFRQSAKDRIFWWRRPNRVATF